MATRTALAGRGIVVTRPQELAGGLAAAIEKAGGSVPCFGDCLPILFGAIRYANASASGLTLDAVTVRQSRFMALDVDSAAGSPLLVQNSQFYQNPSSPMIRSKSPLQLAALQSPAFHLRLEAFVAGRTRHASAPSARSPADE